MTWGRTKTKIMPRMTTVTMADVPKLKFIISERPSPFNMLEIAVKGMLINGTVKVRPS
jgi:hypothetical protein